jgi:Tfp pilus assembly protein PilV
VSGSVAASSRFRRRIDDAGLSLLETIVALVVAALMFSAVAGTLVVTLRASLMSRQNQQAIDIANDGIETVRAMDYASVAMSAADLSGDSHITLVGSTYYFDPDGSGAYKEPVYTATGAGVTHHLTTVTHNNTKYTVGTYVTTPTDSLVNANGDRRVTVIVSWIAGGGQTHTRLSSTIVANTRRGLPLPRYTWTAPVNKTVAQGARLDLGATLVNKGARDSWDLSTLVKSPGGATLPWTFTWYVDSNGGDGIYDSGDTLVSQSGGVFNTGLLDTDQVIKLVAVSNISAAEALQTDTVSLFATSHAQPNAAQQPSLVDKVTVNAPNCVVAGCQYKSLYLHNWADVGNVPTADTTTPTGASVNQMNATAPTGTTFHNYDTDRDNVAGRSLDTGGSGYGDLSKDRSAYWRYGVAAATTFAGTANVTLYGDLASLDPTGTGVVNVFLRAQNGAGWTNVGSASFTAAPWGSSALGSFTVPITGLNFTMAKNALLELEVQVGSSASGTMNFGYDTTAYPAVLSMPYTSGAP